jgi:hypothetical protein
MEESMENRIMELNESLKLVFDITSRIDERMKILIENNNDSKERIEKLFDQQIILLNRITILENKNSAQMVTELKNELTILENKVDHLSDRCIHVEKEVNQQGNKWTTLLDFTFKIGVMLIGSIILWKIGLKP